MNARSIIWNLYRLFVISFVVFATFLNLRLYSHPDNSVVALRPHLAFLKEQLLNGSAERMQTLFPEGYLFNYQLYGATWLNLAFQNPDVRDEALSEARWALVALESEKGKAPFPQGTRPEYGVFYLGWTNWLRGGIVALDPGCTETAEFERVCEILGEAFQTEGPYLQAYPGQAWPCDSTVGMACLALHDQILKARYQAVISNWLSQVGEELFPHQVAPQRQQARGTSQVMIQRFLFEVDPVAAAHQYGLFRERFVTTRFGLPGVREYPLGTEGQGDVDSGPLVFGFSFSATGVIPGAARLHGDTLLYRPFDNLIDTFGFPLFGRYLGGAVPVADGLLLWSRTACSWTGKTPAESDFKPVVSWNWRWGFHLFWLTLVALVALPWGLRRRRRGGPANSD